MRFRVRDMAAAGVVVAAGACGIGDDGSAVDAARNRVAELVDTALVVDRDDNGNEALDMFGAEITSYDGCGFFDPATVTSTTDLGAPDDAVFQVAVSQVSEGIVCQFRWDDGDVFVNVSVFDAFDEVLETTEGQAAITEIGERGPGRLYEIGGRQGDTATRLWVADDDRFAVQVVASQDYMDPIYTVVDADGTIDAILEQFASAPDPDPAARAG